MKKLFTMLLILALILPAAAPAESSYNPALGMTIPEFLTKYNAVPAPLASPFILVDKPYNASKWNGYRVYWYKFDQDHKIIVTLLSMDPSTELPEESGLDMIKIFTKGDSDMVPIFSTAVRIATLFSIDILGTSMAPLRVATVVSSYYENNCRARGIYSYASLDENQKYAVSFDHSDYYVFQISSAEELL